MPNPSKLSLENISTALGSPIRLRILEELARAGGEGRMVKELAKAAATPEGNASKQMKVLREAGVVIRGRGRMYYIAQQFRPEAGSRTLDLGSVLLRFSEAK
jgi:DNA-binding transcriptional ArsR family regulator